MDGPSVSERDALISEFCNIAGVGPSEVTKKNHLESRAFASITDKSHVRFRLKGISPQHTGTLKLR